MSDAAASPVEPVSRSAIEARLAARYRAERRFRAYGIAAIAVAVAALLVLVGSIAVQAVTAFSTYELTLDVYVDPDRLPDQGQDPDSLRRGDYGVMLQEALRSEFPEETSNSRVRQMLGLYARLNDAQLQRRVVANPDLVGETFRFSFPISDDADRYLKGQAARTRWVNASAASVPDYAAAPEDGPVPVTLAAADRERILDAAGIEDASGAVDLGPDQPSAILFSRGGAVKLTRIEPGAAEGELLIAPGEATRNDGRVLLVATSQADRRISDAQIAWTEALRARGDVRGVFNTYLFTNSDSREPELAGVLAALVGSILTMAVTMVLAVPVGVATAIYLEEFAPKNRWTDLVEVNINNLAAVPSIVFGLLGLAVFINFFGMPRSAPLVGGLVLALMTLPIVIISSRAALKAVPPSIREAALGVGASKTQAVFGHVLPLAMPGIMTGSIIGLAQALGETAPLLMIGMVAFVADVPDGFTAPATVMPVQVFNWATQAERAYEARTAAAIVILLTMMILMNAVAIFLRRRFERRW